MTNEEAAKTLAQICADDPDFLAGWDRCGTAAIVADALTVLTGRKFIVATVGYGAVGEAKNFNIVPAEEPKKDVTFVLIPLTARTHPQTWRAFAIPQGQISVFNYPVKEEVATIVTLMFYANDEAAARAYVLEKYPNAKFFGDPP